MKKLLTLILALAMVLSLAACGGNATPAQAPTTKATEAPTTKATEAPTTAEATTEAPTEAPTTTEASPTTEVPTEAPTEPAPEVTHKIQVLNPILEGLEAVNDSMLTRYNTYWMMGWQMADVASEYYWFGISADTMVKVASYVDGYGIELDYASFMEQTLVLEVAEGIAANYPEGMLAGPGIDKSVFPYNVGYIICGPEAIILTPAEGYVAKYLFEDLAMVEADAYDFVCADGYTETIDKEDLEEVKIFFNENRVDATSIAYPTYSLQNILYILPEGVNRDAAESYETKEGTVYKITVANTAMGGQEADTKTFLGGSVQTGYAVPDILKAAGIDSKETVRAVSAGDASTTEMTMEAFLNKYIVPNDSKDRGAYTVGPEQQYGDVTISVGCYAMGKDILFYVPDWATQEAGVSLKDMLEKLEINDYTAVNVICSDGYSELIEAADLESVYIFHLDGRIDTNSVAYPTYTLQNAVVIEILK